MPLTPSHHSVAQKLFHTYNPVLHGQLGQRGDGDEDGVERQGREASVSSAVLVPDGEGDGDDVEVPERQHLLAAERRLPDSRKDRSDLFGAAQKGTIYCQVRTRNIHHTF